MTREEQSLFDLCAELSANSVTTMAGAGSVFPPIGIAPWGMERNPSRRWWQFWRPRWVAMDELQCFEVMHG